MIIVFFQKLRSNSQSVHSTYSSLSMSPAIARTGFLIQQGSYTVPLDEVSFFTLPLRYREIRVGRPGA